MKYIYLFILLILVSCDVVWAQDVPSGYTNELGLRLYDLDDYPGSDSLNANAEAIDAFAATTNDTMSAVRTRIESVIKVTGGLKNAVVSSANLATSLDTNLVKTTGDDNIYGEKQFHSTTTRIKTLYPLSHDQYNMGTNVSRWQHIVAKRFYGEQFILVNPTDVDDTLFFFYDGSKVVLDGRFEADTLSGLSTISIPNIIYTVPDVSDSVITAAYGNAVFFTMPGANFPNLEIINMSDIPAGSAHIVYFKVHDSGAPYYTVTMKDRDGGTSTDGNLELASDFTLTIDDTIVLMYVEGDDVWYEVSRSDN